MFPLLFLYIHRATFFFPQHCLFGGLPNPVWDDNIWLNRSTWSSGESYYCVWHYRGDYKRHHPKPMKVGEFILPYLKPCLTCFDCDNFINSATVRDINQEIIIILISLLEFTCWQSVFTMCLPWNVPASNMVCNYILWNRIEGNNKKLCCVDLSGVKRATFIQTINLHLFCPLFHIT